MLRRSLALAILAVLALTSGGRDGPPVGGGCRALQVPAAWSVRSAVLADATNDGTPECVLVVWRPWRDWKTRVWAGTPGPTAPWRDARGRSAHVALLAPLGGGRYRERWVGSALAQPALAARVERDGRGAVLVVDEGSYAGGPDGGVRAVSRWRWTGFGFRLVGRGGR